MNAIDTIFVNDLSNTSSRRNHRLNALLESLGHIKNLTPDERFDLFLSLQLSLTTTYMEGLRNRYPGLAASQLIEKAKIEAENRVKRKQSLS